MGDTTFPTKTIQEPLCFCSKTEPHCVPTFSSSWSSRMDRWFRKTCLWGLQVWWDSRESDLGICCNDTRIWMDSSKEMIILTHMANWKLHKVLILSFVYEIVSAHQDFWVTLEKGFITLYSWFREFRWSIEMTHCVNVKRRNKTGELAWNLEIRNKAKKKKLWNSWHLEHDRFWGNQF